MLNLKLIELKTLATLCVEEGFKNIAVALAPWDEDGYVLLFKTKKMIYILRTKNHPLPRVFKYPETAFGICKELGFTSMSVTFTQQQFSFEKPHWIQPE